MRHDQMQGDLQPRLVQGRHYLNPRFVEAKDKDVRRELDARLKVLEAAMRHDLEGSNE